MSDYYRYAYMEDKHKGPKLDPKCLKGELGFAVDNRGRLIPCCKSDDKNNDYDEIFQKLMPVSVISRNNKIEDILETKEWKAFHSNLLKNIAPNACYYACKAGKSGLEKQVNTTIDPNTGEVKNRGPE